MEFGDERTFSEISNNTGVIRTNNTSENIKLDNPLNLITPLDLDYFFSLSKKRRDDSDEELDDNSEPIKKPKL